MSYEVKKTKGIRPFKIVNKESGEVVGSSRGEIKAIKSIGHREHAEFKKRPWRGKKTS